MGDGRWGRLDGHLRKEKTDGDEIRKVLVLGDDQSTTDSAPSESSDGSELSELVAMLQLGEEEPAEAAGAETPRGGAAENAFGSVGSTGTVLRYLLESSVERSGEETASEDGAIEPLVHHGGSELGTQYTLFFFSLHHGGSELGTRYTLFSSSVHHGGSELGTRHKLFFEGGTRFFLGTPWREWAWYTRFFFGTPWRE